ncbi:MAG: dipeptidase [Lachnospiraceae bacterium]
MNLIDLHCDTLYRLLREKEGQDLKSTDCDVNLSGMREAGTMAQFFACFTYLKDHQKDQSPEEGYEECFHQALEMIDLMEKQCALFPEEIAPARSYEEIIKNKKDGKISAVLTVEEGGILNGNPERIRLLYEKGVRLMTLMWNYENCFGYPNSRDAQVMEQGLKDFGIEMVRQMGELGMIADVSHASDGTFWDILKYAKGPVVASHSNCRALCTHPRNLSDDMIHALADKGGIAGLNFYGAFLGTEKESRIEEMAAHVLHMIKTGGSEFPAVGTDFDGFDGMEHMDVPNMSQMGRLWEALRKKGLSEDQLDLIWGGNALRVLKTLG